MRFDSRGPGLLGDAIERGGVDDSGGVDQAADRSERAAACGDRGGVVPRPAKIDRKAERRDTGYAGDGGAATNAALGGFSCNIRCGGVAADSAGNLFIADGTTGRVRRVSTDGIITTVFSIADVDGPSAVAIDSMGQLFVADDRSVRKVSSDGSITTIAERVYGVLALAVDSEGNIFAATSNYEAFFNNERIIRIAPDGQITTIAGTGLGGFSGDGGPASRASLRGPSGVALDAAGNIYITDSGNDAIRVLRPVSMRGE